MMDTLTQENKNMFFGLYLATGILGLVGNVLSFRTFWRERRQSFFHLQLAVANVISLLSTTMAGPSALRGSWMFGHTMCNWFGFQAYMAGFAEMTFTCIICIECYLATRKTSFYHSFSTGTFYKVSFAVWLYAVCFSVAPLLGWNSYVKENDSTSCGLDLVTNKSSFRTYLMTTQVVFLAFAMTAIVCLMMSVCKLGQPSGTFEPIFNDIELVKVSGCLLLVLGIFCLPYYLRVVWYLNGNPPVFNTFLSVEFSHLAMKLGSAFHPYTYFMVSPRFRNVCISMVTGVDLDKKRG